jgi:hypothetical protein
VIIFFLVTGCDTDTLHELNINPQAVSEIDMNYLFAGASLSIASNGFSGDNRYIDWRTNIGLAGGAIQQLTTSGSISAIGNYYRHNPETSAAPFEFSYRDQLRNIHEILKQTGPGGFQDGQRVNMRSAARILKAWTFGRLVDFYDNIPYSDANLGIEGTFFPTYDNAEDIMPDILNELAEAVDSLSSGNPEAGFAGADMIYQGDITKWKKFGNSVMLRYAMRVSNVAPGLADQYVARAMQSPGVFESNDDNVWINMAVGPSEWTNQNGISRAFFPGDGGNQSTMSETLINFLKGSDMGTVADDDPRLMVFSSGIGDWTAMGWTPIDTDPLNQLGAPPGYYQDEIEAQFGYQFTWNITFSRLNVLMMDDDDPYLIMSHSEIEFLQAEALERGIGSGISGTPQSHYDSGVKSAMQMYTPFDPSLAVDDAAVATYLATYPYGGGGVTGSESNLEQIGWQMWACKFLNWWEAWSDWRRTGYPPLVEYTSDNNNVTGGKIPVRLMYPDTEVGSNPNFNQASNNNYTSKVWWDVVD